MKVSEALQIIHAGPAEGAPLVVVLACGFTPLHLETFLTAHLQRALPERKIAVRSGLYGDLAGTVRRAASEQADVVAIAMEWPDLDLRLGYRNLGGWGPVEEANIVAQVKATLGQLAPLVLETARTRPVVVSLPTLPLPPAFHTSGWQCGSTQASLEAAVYQAGAELAAARNVSIVNAQQLAWDSPPGQRYDLKSDLFTGLPYTIAHASALGQAMAHLAAPATPKKGLITDLDDTLWDGIVGEVGPQGVSWDLQSHSQLHGLYQQTLRALADQGVLIAVASKNDSEVAEAALARADLLLPKEKIFPVEIHWHAKSGSMGRILSAWNIGADAVVFVDDSPMELAEVQAAFPQMECLLFPKKDYAGAAALLRHLRDRFGKARLTEEDQLRRESLRQARRFTEQAQNGAAPDDFLRALDARITLDRDAASDPRALELVNKTNQFNLNGRRFEPVEWAGMAGRPGGFVWSVAYQDKFGPLGKIAIIAGTCRAGRIELDTWVMSCRAFARRIEHQCLHLLFAESGASEIAFAFRATDRNSPLREFLTELLGRAPGEGSHLSRQTFAERCPPLFHAIAGVTHG